MDGCELWADVLGHLPWVRMCSGVVSCVAAGTEGPPRCVCTRPPRLPVIEFTWLSLAHPGTREGTQCPAQLLPCRACAIGAAVSGA